jgi:TP901 family phage tail tape measure protein
MASSTLAKLWVELGFKDGGYKKGVKNAAAGLSKLNTAGNQMATIFGGVANKAVMALTGSLTAFMAASVVVGAKFDREMAFVGAISGATEEDLQKLEDRARSLGKTTMYSATEAANAMQSFARTGMDANQIIAATGPALHLAGAAGHDLTATTQTMAATMAQFNLESSEAVRIADVFSVAITQSLFDMRSLSEAMKYGGTVGKAFKMSLEETTAALSLFRNMGLEGSLAGTQFRMSMASAAKMSKEKEKILKRLGLTVGEISPEFNSFSQIMENLAETTIGTGDALVLFGRRAGANMAGLIDDFRSGQTEFYDLRDALEQSTGVSSQLYDKATNNVLDKFTIVKSAFQELMLTVFDSYRDPLMDLLAAITEVLQFTATGVTESGQQMESGFTSAIEYMTAFFLNRKEEMSQAFRELMTLAAEFAGVIVRIAPHLSQIMKLLLTMWAVGKMVAFIGMLLQIQVALIAVKAQALAAGVAMYTALAPIIAVAAAAALLAGGLYYLASSNDAASDSTARFAAALKEAKAAQRVLNDQQSIGISKASESAVAWARAAELQLAASGDLDEVRERELRKLQELDEASARDGLARGILIKTMTDQGESITSVRLLIHEMNLETDAGVVASETLVAAEENLLAQIKEKKAKITALNTVLGEYKSLSDELPETHGHLIDALNKENGSIEKVKATMHALAPVLGNLQKGYNGLTASIKAAEHAEKRLAQTEAGIIKNKQKLLKTTSSGGGGHKQAIAARIKLMETATAAEFKAMNTEAAYRRFQLAQELKEAKEVFDKEIKYRLRRGQSVIKLRQQMVETLAQIEAASVGKEIAAQRKLIGKLTEMRGAYVQGEEDSILAAVQNRFAQMVLAENASYAAALALAKNHAGATEKLHAQHHAVLLEITATRQAAEADLRLKRTKDVENQIAQIRVDTEDDTIRTIKQVNQELLKELKAAEFASESEKERIRQLFAVRRANAVVELEQRILNLLGGFENQRVLLVKERDSLIAELETKGAEDLEHHKYAIILKYAALIAAARRGEREEYKANLEAQGDFIDRFWDRSVAGAVMFNREMGVVGGQIGDSLKPGLENAKTDFKEWLKWKIDHFKRNLEQFGEEHPELAGWASAAQDLFNKVSKGAKAAGSFVGEKISAGVDQAKDRTTVLGKGFHVASVAAQGIGIALKATKTVFQMMLGSVLKFGKGAVAAGKMVAAGVGQITAAWGKTLDALSTYLGFSFSITDGMERANELMDERADTEQSIADLDADIAAAQASGDSSRLAELMAERDELNAALDKLPATHKEAAEAYAAEMVTGAVDTLNKMVESGPAMILAMAEEAPRLITALVQKLPELIQGLAASIPELMRVVAEGIPQVMAVLAEELPGLFQAIFEMLPTLVTALMDALIILIPMVGEIISMFIMALPEIFTAFFEKLPMIIDALIGSIVMIVQSLVEAIPLIIEGFIANLGPLLQSLIEGSITIVLLLLRQIPKLIRSLIKQIPVLVDSTLSQLPYMISAVISALPDIIRAVVQLLPKILFALLDMIPKLIVSVIDNLPDIIKMIVYNIPYIAEVLVKELVWGLLQKIGMLVGKALYKFYRFFADMMIELWGFIAHPFKPKKRPKTETFGDTPGVQHADESQDVVFGAGDYYAAAKNPLDLLRQSLEAVLNLGAIDTAQGGLAGAAASPGITGGALMLPNMQPVVQGILQATDAITAHPGTAGGAGGIGQEIRVTVTAEGSVLDDVLYRAAKRGHAPKLIDMMKKVSGVDVGMWRGGFADES